MNDLELLELAAKAAGYESVGFSDAGECLIGYISPSRYDFCWSPLADDGDAMRLSVELKISIHYEHMFGFMDFKRPERDVPPYWVVFANSCKERIKPDPCAALRRAIVRAAADIGKAMK